jgi:TetR/AcrR family transcriptional repressor of nem operon
MSMTGRQAAAARTKDNLIETGLRLAERTGLAGLSINLLVEEAGVSKGTFFHHFGDRATYLVELHRSFHDQIFDQTLASVGDISPGPGRLLAAAQFYLDACLDQRGVRALLLEARAEQAIAEEISTRNARAAELCRPDFAALGWPHPAQGARLWVGLVAETALVEYEGGHRDPDLRAALAHFISPALPTSS